MFESVDLTINLKLIIGIITSLFGAYFWKYKNTKAKLEESHYRHQQTLLLQRSSFEEKYKSTLYSLIGWIESIYNPSTWILNYSRHITIALIYSFMVFTVFWTLGASGSLGSIEIFSGSVSLQSKIITLPFFLFYILLLFYLYQDIEKWSDFIIKKLPKKLQLFHFVKIFIITLIVILVVGGVGTIVIGIEIGGVEIVVVGGGIVMVIVVKQTIKSILQTLLIFFISWFLIFTFFSSSNDAWLVASIITLLSLPALLSIKKIGLGLNFILLGVIILGFVSSSDNIVIITLFFIILPLVNALLDYISLRISLFMANKILKDVSLIKALLHLLIDTIVAISFIYLLATFIYLSITLLNGYIDSPIPIKEILVATKTDPFNIENGWISFMLISTLVPTFVHFTIALGALLIEVIPSQRALRDLSIYEQRGEKALLDNASHYFTRIFFAEIVLGVMIIGLIVFVGWYAF